MTDLALFELALGLCGFLLGYGFCSVMDRIEAWLTERDARLAEGEGGMEKAA